MRNLLSNRVITDIGLLYATLWCHCSAPSSQLCLSCFYCFSSSSSSLCWECSCSAEHSILTSEPRHQTLTPFPSQCWLCSRWRLERPVFVFSKLKTILRSLNSLWNIWAVHILNHRDNNIDNNIQILTGEDWNEVMYFGIQSQGNYELCLRDSTSQSQ